MFDLQQQYVVCARRHNILQQVVGSTELDVQHPATRSWQHQTAVWVCPHPVLWRYKE
jgi:hypothetical protein